LKFIRGVITVWKVITILRTITAAVLGRPAASLPAIIIAVFRFLVFMLLRLSLWIFICTSAGSRTRGSSRRLPPTLPLRLGMRLSLRRHGFGGKAPPSGSPAVSTGARAEAPLPM
jgi:hypothetical protein